MPPSPAQHAAALQAAREIDGGTGERCMAILVTVPRGAARAAVAARLARWAAERVEVVAVIIPPGADDDWVDAHAELMTALHQDRDPAEATA